MLAPAIALLNRLGFGGKFMLTALICLLPIVYLLSIAASVKYETLVTAGREVQGIAFIHDLQPLLIATQRHRGLSNAWLSGDAAAEPKVRQAARDLETALAGVRARAEDDALGQAEAVRALASQWAALAAQGPATPAAESFRRHTALVHDILALAEDVAFRSGLSLDPKPDSFFLQEAIVHQAWPLIELLAATRGLTTGIVARKAITADEKALLVAQLAQIQAYAKRLTGKLGYAQADNTALGAALQPLHDRLMAEIEQATALVRSQALDGAFSLASTDYFAATTRPVDAAVALTSAATEQLVAILGERQRDSRNQLLFGAAFLIVTLGLMAYLVLGMQAALLHTVREVHGSTSALAAGDLTRAPRVASRDELGQIAGDIDAGRLALAQLITHAKGVAEQVAAASREVAQGAGHIAQASNRQSEAISSAAAAVEQLTVSVSHTADQTQQANAAAAEAGELSRQGQSVATAASQEMAAIAGAVRDAARQIEGLNSRAAEISGIVKVIRDIADQTNLLALNAAIEAARAGEQGRGFAVVADEVRKLAERTSNATTEITTMIGAIQHETRQAVAGMDASSQRAQAGERSVGETARVLNDIHAATVQVNEKVDEIAGASLQQRAASTDIAQNVERIAQMVEANSASSEQVSATAANLGELAARLQTELGRFRV